MSVLVRCLAVLAMGVCSLQAQTYTLGARNFNDGAIVSTAAFLNASLSEPAPFHDFNGSGDVGGPNYTASFTFTYPAAQLVLNPTLTIGILDHDSKASGNQVASCTIDGVDLTTLVNTAFEARGGANSEYDIYTIALPLTAIPILLDGSATVSLTLQGPGLDVTANPTASNGAALDFATLALVPEPATHAWLLLGAAALIRRRRHA